MFTRSWRSPFRRSVRKTCALAAVFITTASLAAEPLFGVFGENSMERVLAFEKWLGRPVDMILCTVDFQNGRIIAMQTG
jgi:hypothetical protein